VLQCVTVCCSVSHSDGILTLRSVIQRVAVWYSVVQRVLCVAVCFIQIASGHYAVCRSVVQCGAICSTCCSVLHSDGIMILRRVLQCDAV